MRIYDLPSMPTPRSSFGAVRIGDQIVAVGGHKGVYHHYDKENFTDAVEVFDVNRAHWDRRRDAPFLVQGFRMYGSGADGYAFGGLEYTPALEIPRRKKPKQLDRQVYLIGGWDATPAYLGDSSGRFWRSIDVFDLGRHEFVPIDIELSGQLRRASASVSSEQKIVVVGGLHQSDFLSNGEAVPSNSAVCVALDPSMTFYERWTLLPNLPKSVFSPGIGVANRDLYVVGGLSDSQELLDTIYVLHPNSDHWEPAPIRLNSPRMFPEVISLSASLLGILGGHGYVDPVATFEVLEIA